MNSLTKIPVFFGQNMVADSGSFSPSAAKPEKAVASWTARKMPIDIRTPRPVTNAQMSLAHDPKMIHRVLNLQKANGFGNYRADVARSLRYTSGSMLSAAKEAIKNGRVAAAPCSGFHHAGYDFSGGFCTFNGLMIAARTLQYEGYGRRVGIIDFDQHYGDGTDNIINVLKPQGIKHFTAGRKFRSPKQVAEFFRIIPKIIDSMSDSDVIIYQAGADPHIDDPLGGWLTTAQLKKRDELVFSTAKRLKIPVAWNLAGGYQTPFENVLAIHDNTMMVCADTYL